MGFDSLTLLSLLLIISNSDLLVPTDSITFPGDIQVLKELKNTIDPNSITPGSCLSSWDFAVDPCDNAFSERFTCGFRCDVAVSTQSRVTELSLDRAGYTGLLTRSSWNLPYLETLDLADNFFSGPIPQSLGNLTRLRRLTLSRNSFSGEIPDSLGNSLSTLEELYLDNNLLQGPIPPSFTGLQSLRRLELQSNKVFGEFPDLGSLQNLYFFDGSDNMISGPFPTTLPASLVEISMRNNALSGEVPDTIGDLQFLQVLDVSNNRLSGSLMSVLFNHPSLQQLTLSHNRFSGLQEPGDSGLTSELIAMDLGYNELTGFLPSFMAMMPKLSALSLENNRYTGMIPFQYAVKAVVPGTGVAPFERLLLSGNYLYGPIPSPMMKMKPGSAMVSLVDNCLIRCPSAFFFCVGGVQKSLSSCKSFSPVIP
eukprot:TRINITY_DN2249_c0_g1_i1.p1 TRINITY_DN2249_c0_g1~~TRINITY_DN2249_c0_g1_i1.p1  ORF type:complete len:439 (-),score=11.54 TRINITY_DN2249_c0_g1_i1:23-1294(-)